MTVHILQNRLRFVASQQQEKQDLQLKIVENKYSPYHIEELLTKTNFDNSHGENKFHILSNAFMDVKNQLRVLGDLIFHIELIRKNNDLNKLIVELFKYTETNFNQKDKKKESDFKKEISVQCQTLFKELLKHSQMHYETYLLVTSLFMLLINNTEDHNIQLLRAQKNIFTEVISQLSIAVDQLCVLSSLDIENLKNMINFHIANIYTIDSINQALLINIKKQIEQSIQDKTTITPEISKRLDTYISLSIFYGIPIQTQSLALIGIIGILQDKVIKSINDLIFQRNGASFLLCNTNVLPPRYDQYKIISVQFLKLKDQAERLKGLSVKEVANDISSKNQFILELVQKLKTFQTDFILFEQSVNHVQALSQKKISQDDKNVETIQMYLSKIQAELTQYIANIEAEKLPEKFQNYSKEKNTTNKDIYLASYNLIKKDYLLHFLKSMFKFSYNLFFVKQHIQNFIVENHMDQDVFQAIILISQEKQISSQMQSKINNIRIANEILKFLVCSEVKFNTAKLSGQQLSAMSTGSFLSYEGMMLELLTLVSFRLAAMTQVFNSCLNNDFNQFQISVNIILEKFFFEQKRQEKLAFLKQFFDKAVITVMFELISNYHKNGGDLFIFAKNFFDAFHIAFQTLSTLFDIKKEILLTSVFQKFNIDKLKIKNTAIKEYLLKNCKRYAEVFVWLLQFEEEQGKTYQLNSKDDDILYSFLKSKTTNRAKILQEVISVLKKKKIEITQAYDIFNQGTFEKMIVNLLLKNNNLTIYILFMISHAMNQKTLPPQFWSVHKYQKSPSLGHVAVILNYEFSSFLTLIKSWPKSIQFDANLELTISIMQSIQKGLNGFFSLPKYNKKINKLTDMLLQYQTLKKANKSSEIIELQKKILIKEAKIVQNFQYFQAGYEKILYHQKIVFTEKSKNGFLVPKEYRVTDMPNRLDNYQIDSIEHLARIKITNMEKFARLGYVFQDHLQLFTLSNQNIFINNEFVAKNQTDHSVILKLHNTEKAHDIKFMMLVQCTTPFKDQFKTLKNVQFNQEVESTAEKYEAIIQFSCKNFVPFPIINVTFKHGNKSIMLLNKNALLQTAIVQSVITDKNAFVNNTELEKICSSGLTFASSILFFSEQFTKSIEVESNSGTKGNFQLLIAINPNNTFVSIAGNIDSSFIEAKTQYDSDSFSQTKKNINTFVQETLKSYNLKTKDELI